MMFNEKDGGFKRRREEGYVFEMEEKHFVVERMQKNALAIRRLVKQERRRIERER